MDPVDLTEASYSMWFYAWSETPRWRFIRRAFYKIMWHGCLVSMQEQISERGRA